jgi:hypothetical protein
MIWLLKEEEEEEEEEEEQRGRKNERCHSETML